MARPPFVPTEQQRLLVAKMAGLGFPQDQICLLVENDKGEPISEWTLKKYFAADLRSGVIKANVNMAGRLYRAGMDGNVACMIFWLKTKAGWRETNRLEHTGADGQPLVPPGGMITFDDGGPGST